MSLAQRPGSTRAPEGVTRLRHSDLWQSLLHQADLRDADLRSADLSWTELIRADLRGANLEGATLKAVKLTGARCGAQTHWPAGYDPRRQGAVRE